MSEKNCPIMAAEDEASDRMIFEMAFQRANLPFPLVFVRDGHEAVDYLSGRGRYADRAAHPLPVLIVLDLKMPRMNGLDVLAWLVEQRVLKNIPAVMLSSSGNELDMNKARQLGAREYFVKPHSLDELIKILHQMQARWLCAASTDGPA